MHTPFDRLKKTATLPTYFLYGTEDFLIEKALNILKEKILASAFKDLNCQIFHLSESDISSIISACETIPFMGDRRVVIVKEADKMNSQEAARFTEYAKKPCPTTSLILIANAVKIGKDNELFLELEKRGCIFAFNSISKKELPHWIKTEIKSSGRDISDNAVGCLVDMVGDDLTDLKKEIEKLILFIGEKKTIEVKDVEDVASCAKVNSIFEFTDFLGKKDLKSALKALNKIIEIGEEPLRVLGMIARQFRILLKVTALKKKGLPSGRIAQISGVSPYYIERYIEQTRSFTEHELFSIFNKLSGTDIALKSRGMSNLTLERLVMEICF